MPQHHDTTTPDIITSGFPSSVSDIKHCLYINLESRKDRREHIDQELKSIGINGIRFNAVKLQNGRIGCSMSHLKCLQIAKKITGHM